MFGVSALHKTPLAGLYEFFFPGTKDFLKSVAEDVNSQLTTLYDLPGNDDPDVSVVDLFAVSDALEQLGSNTYVDFVHSTESSNLLAADLISQQLSTGFSDFLTGLAA